MTTDRPNRAHAAVVDDALALAEQQGVDAAAAFLAAHGVGFAVTCRVLKEPARRRAADFSQRSPAQRTAD
jgi:hypothetical protein